MWEVEVTDEFGELVARMTGRKKFSDLKKPMGEARVKKAEARTRELLAEILLPELRKFSGKTQNELADVLGVSQPALSKFEHQDDMQVSTLSRLIEAMGGKLEIIAHLPDGDFRLAQFEQQPR